MSELTVAFGGQPGSPYAGRFELKYPFSPLFVTYFWVVPASSASCLTQMTLSLVLEVKKDD